MGKKISFREEVIVSVVVSTGPSALVDSVVSAFHDEVVEVAGGGEVKVTSAVVFFSEDPALEAVSVVEVVLQPAIANIAIISATLK